MSKPNHIFSTSIVFVYHGEISVYNNVWSYNCHVIQLARVNFVSFDKEIVIIFLLND